MSLNFYTLCVIYLVYSFLGWVGETVVATAKGRRFTNRGVASGPFCFVYGTAGVLITIGLNDQRTSLAALFFGSMIYATVVEWLTAKLLERIHHRRWWDYSDKKFNLDGYVCLQYSLLWGSAGHGGSPLGQRPAVPALRPPAAAAVPRCGVGRHGAGRPRPDLCHGGGQPVCEPPPTA